MIRKLKFKFRKNKLVIIQIQSDLNQKMSTADTGVTKDQMDIFTSFASSSVRTKQKKMKRIKVLKPMKKCNILFISHMKCTYTVL